MAYLDTFVAKLNKVKISADVYNQGTREWIIDATAELLSDINRYLAGVIKVNFTLPDDLPSIDNINLESSVIYIYDTNETTIFASFHFLFLQRIGFQFVKGKTVSLYLTIPVNYFYKP